ncbi:MAG TPA: hypothetical protein VNO30_17510 [Kofleriaceae bacterium]|nr:hypothetical protein [Kofleriaceae bacterium]
MATDAVTRAMARRPKLPPVEEPLRAPPPRTNVVAHQPYWEPSVRDGVAVKGWVFNATVDESDPHGHDYFYEVAYELDGQVHVFSREKGIDPWDWRFTGPYGDWFRETVMGCRAATVLIHPAREPVLFGDTEPFEIVHLGAQVARARAAPAARRAKETEYAIEVLQEASSADRRAVAALLAPFASAYTERAHDDFYIVADLYAHARKGGDVLAILERIAPKVLAARKEYWAAE